MVVWLPCEPCPSSACCLTFVDFSEGAELSFPLDPLPLLQACGPKASAVDLPQEVERVWVALALPNLLLPNGSSSGGLPGHSTYFQPSHCFRLYLGVTSPPLSFSAGVF